MVTQMTSYSCYDVAMAILRHPDFRLDDPTDIPYMLNYLAFYCQVYACGSLFQEDFEAWVHGPVVPELLRALTNANLPQPVKPLDADAQSIVDSVMDDMAGYDKLDLRYMAKEEEAYQLTREGLAVDEPCNRVIPKELLR